MKEVAMNQNQDRAKINRPRRKDTPEYNKIPQRTDVKHPSKIALVDSICQVGVRLNVDQCRSLMKKNTPSNDKYGSLADYFKRVQDLNDLKEKIPAYRVRTVVHWKGGMGVENVRWDNCPLRISKGQNTRSISGYFLLDPDVMQQFQNEHLGKPVNIKTQLRSNILHITVTPA
jgi:hypothetical protein